MGDSYQGLEHCAINLVNDFGMETENGCILSTNGFTMWCEKSENGDSLTFKLDDTEPLGKLEVWNYNRIAADGTDYTVCGLREVKIYHSIDAKLWTELKGRGYPYCLKKLRAQPICSRQILKTAT